MADIAHWFLIDLQRKRDENLERNRLFFENLLGKPELNNKTDSTEGNIDDNVPSSSSYNNISRFVDNFDVICKDRHFNALQKFPEQIPQVNQLFSYLRNVCFNFLTAVDIILLAYFI